MRGDLARTSLPIPDRPHTGLVTYDAKDPDTSFPPIEPLRPPAGAPNVLRTSWFSAWRAGAVADEVGRRGRVEEGECLHEHVGCLVGAEPAGEGQPR
jgi:hypothetical protein